MAKVTQTDILRRLKSLQDDLQEVMDDLEDVFTDLEGTAFEEGQEAGLEEAKNA